MWVWLGGYGYGGMKSSPTELIHRTREALLDYQHAHERGASAGVTARPIQWTTPPAGWVLVNWDAALDKERGQMGLGVLLRDHTEKMIVSKCVTRMGFVNPADAEAMAAIVATQTCREWGIDRVQFVGDAKVVVDAVM